jgi:hypothetical protein
VNVGKKYFDKSLTKVGSFGIFSFYDREVTMIIDIAIIDYPAIKPFSRSESNTLRNGASIHKLILQNYIQLIKESQVMIRQEYISSNKMGLLILSNVQYEKLFENNYI